MLQKIQNKFFVSSIIAFELVALTSHYYEGNTSIPFGSIAIGS